MKERPIIFKTEMVEAILEGRKTQTRRIMRDQPRWDSMLNAWSVPFGYCQNPRKSSTLLDQVAYVQPGDILWVKENFRIGKSWEGSSPSKVASFLKPSDVFYPSAKEDAPSWAGRLRPSIHMPREFSRLTLEVADVRVMRLQDITMEDSIAEGLVFNEEYGKWQGSAEAKGGIRVFYHNPIKAFQDLWLSIHGKGSWDQNPWVFVYTFKVLEVKQ